MSCLLCLHLCVGSAIGPNGDSPRLHLLVSGGKGVGGGGGASPSRMSFQAFRNIKTCKSRIS